MKSVDEHLSSIDHSFKSIFSSITLKQAMLTTLDSDCTNKYLIYRYQLLRRIDRRRRRQKLDDNEIEKSTIQILDFHSFIFLNVFLHQLHHDATQCSHISNVKIEWRSDLATTFLIRCHFMSTKFDIVWWWRNIGLDVSLNVQKNIEAT